MAALCGQAAPLLCLRKSHCDGSRRALQRDALQRPGTPLLLDGPRAATVSGRAQTSRALREPRRHSTRSSAGAGDSVNGAPASSLTDTTAEEKFLAIDDILQQARDLNEDFLFDADGGVEDSEGNAVEDPFASREEAAAPSPPQASVESVSSAPASLGSIYDAAEDATDDDGRRISARRTVQAQFTCNKCGHRTTRLVNPLALVKGTVFVQCAGCETVHQLVDNLGLVEEHDYRRERGGDGA